MNLNIETTKENTFKLTKGNTQIIFGFSVELSDKTLFGKSANIISSDICDAEKMTVYTYEFVWPEGERARYILEKDKKHPSINIHIEICNLTKTELSVKRINLIKIERNQLFLGNGIKDWAILKNGSRKNDSVGLHQFGNDDFDINDINTVGNELGVTDGNNNASKEHKKIESYYLTVIKSISLCESLLIGFITMSRQKTFSEFYCNNEEDAFQGLNAVCETDQKVVSVNHSIRSEKLILDLDNPFEAIDRYAKLSGRAPNEIKFPRALRGWCSWYFHYESVTQEKVLDSLRIIDEHKLPMDVILIDMGWEQRLGNWYPNYCFPKGMPWLSDRIHRSGLKAGIWVSPFWIEPRSYVHREHPEWLLKDKSGKPVVFTCHIDGYVIDTTIPEACEWIGEEFRRITEDWGFELVKVDFLRAVNLFEDIQYKNNFTGTEALMLGMQAIRKGVGENTYIVACGGDYGPTLGIADANRTSNDISANWDSVKRTFKKNILRFWMNKNWWRNDPDCLVIRNEKEGVPGEIAANPDHNQIGKFNKIEVDTILALFKAIGCNIFFGDDLSQLSIEKIEILKRYLDELNTSPSNMVPRDMFESRYPQILHNKIDENMHEITIINWEDNPISKSWGIYELIGRQKDGEYIARIKDKIIGKYKKEDFIEELYISAHGHVCISICMV